MTKLRLGPINQEKPTKVTLEVPGTLMRDIADYAKVHARINGLASPLLPCGSSGDDRALHRRRPGVFEATADM